MSSIVTLLLLVKPALWRLAGCRQPPAAPVLRARLAEDLRHSTGRDEYQRASLEVTEQGAVVHTGGDQSSNRLQSFNGANCLIRLSGDQTDFPAGSKVSVLPFEGWV